jgi:hypothetical protein
MVRENRRRHERVKINTKIKLPGDAGWAECENSDVSGSGLFFETGKQLKEGDFVTMQFMLHSQSHVNANVHFFASARVVRIVPQKDNFQIAVEFIIEDAVRKEILKAVEAVKSSKLRIDRPTTIQAVLHKDKEEKSPSSDGQAQ